MPSLATSNLTPYLLHGHQHRAPTKTRRRIPYCSQLQNAKASSAVHQHPCSSQCGEKRPVIFSLDPDHQPWRTPATGLRHQDCQREDLQRLWLSFVKYSEGRNYLGVFSVRSQLPVVMLCSPAATQYSCLHYRTAKCGRLAHCRLVHIGEGLIKLKISQLKISREMIKYYIMFDLFY